MSEEASTGRSAVTVAVILLVIAGALFIIGAFVDAATVDVQGQSQSSTLWDQDWEGIASLVLGIVLLLAAVLVWARSGRQDMRAVGIVVVLVGLAGAALALYKIFNLESEAVDRLSQAVAQQQGVPVEAAKVSIQQGFDAGAISVSASLGLYLVVIAGILAVAAGIAVLRSRPATRAA